MADNISREAYDAAIVAQYDDDYATDEDYDTPYDEGDDIEAAELTIELQRDADADDYDYDMEADDADADAWHSQYDD